VCVVSLSAPLDTKRSVPISLEEGAGITDWDHCRMCLPRSVCAAQPASEPSRSMSCVLHAAGDSKHRT
jgi:hypothetical protein